MSAGRIIVGAFALILGTLLPAILTTPPPEAVPSTYHLFEDGSMATPNGSVCVLPERGCGE